MTAGSDRRATQRLALGLAALGLVGVMLGVAAISTGVAGPLPGASAPVAGAATGPQGGEATAPTTAPTTATVPVATPAVSGSVPVTTAVPTPVPTVVPEPTPARLPVDVDIVRDHASVFAHERKNTWCAAAGVQMTLAVLGLGDTSSALQREIQGRVHRWESYADSHNGRWGPVAMARALDAYGAKGYEVRTYKTRQGALRDAARAIETTGAPVILLAWRGAHTWVMTGFRADADPAVFSDAKIGGTYILDPWYPDVSSIWGRSDRPGTFQDNAEMVRNYLPWKRPEGKYPGRDGRFLAVIPTVAVNPVD